MVAIEPMQQSPNHPNQPGGQEPNWWEFRFKKF